MRKLAYFMLLVGLSWEAPLSACDSVDRVLLKFEEGTRSRELAEEFLINNKSINFKEKFTSDEEDKREAKVLYDVLMKYQNFDIVAKTPWDLDKNYREYIEYISGATIMPLDLGENDHEYTSNDIEGINGKKKWKVRILNGLKSFFAYRPVLRKPEFLG